MKTINNLDKITTRLHLNSMNIIHTDDILFMITTI